MGLSLFSLVQDQFNHKTVTPASGLQVRGYAPPFGNLRVAFTDAVGTNQDYSVDQAFKDSSIYTKITKLGLTKDHDNNGTNGVLIEASENLISTLNKASTQIANIKFNFLNEDNMRVSFSVSVNPNNGVYWTHTYMDNKHIHKANVNSADIFNQFGKGTTGEFDLEDINDAAIGRDFKKVPVNIVPIKGWARRPERYQAEFSDTAQITIISETSPVLTDNQGLFALGYHIDSAIDKITPFVLIDKSKPLASKAYCHIQFGSDTPIALKKTDVTGVTTVQEFKEEAPSLSAFPDLSMKQNITLIFADLLIQS